MSLILDQGFSGRRHPRRLSSRRGRLSFRPWPSWLVGKLLGYKTGAIGRKQFGNLGRRGRQRPAETCPEPVIFNQSSRLI